jgi:hypothetical protein
MGFSGGFRCYFSSVMRQLFWLLRYAVAGLASWLFLVRPSCRQYTKRNGMRVSGVYRLFEGCSVHVLANRSLYDLACNLHEITLWT